MKKNFINTLGVIVASVIVALAIAISFNACSAHTEALTEYTIKA